MASCVGVFNTAKLRGGRSLLSYTTYGRVWGDLCGCVLSLAPVESTEPDTLGFPADSTKDRREK